MLLASVIHRRESWRAGRRAGRVSRERRHKGATQGAGAGPFAALEVAADGAMTDIAEARCPAGTGPRYLRPQPNPNPGGYSGF